jgi:hypothetical protein
VIERSLPVRTTFTAESGGAWRVAVAAR